MSFALLHRSSLIAAIVLALALPAKAQDANPPLKVVTRVLPPFVIKSGEQYGGFSIELWQAIALELGRTSEFKETANVKDLLEGVRSGGDLGIAAISITSERIQKFDFSQPIFESGLQIMVPEQTTSGLGLRDIWNVLTTGAMPSLLGILIALVLVPAHIAWWAERKRHDRSFPPGYLHGIAHAIWWATGASVGQQPMAPSSVLGRFMAWLAIPVSIIFVAYFTGAVTAAITVQQLQGSIQGPADLPGKRVGTTANSTSAAFLKADGVQPLEFAAITDAFVNLEAGKLDAVVFDAPVLLYYANNAGLGHVQVVGPIFRKENYGIAFPPESPLRNPVNAALLKLRENGTYDRIYQTWFGAK